MINIFYFSISYMQNLTHVIYIKKIYSFNKFNLFQLFQIKLLVNILINFGGP